MEEGRSAFKMLTGIPTVKRPLGRHKCRWEDNIRMNLKEIGRGEKLFEGESLSRDSFGPLLR